MWPGRVCDNESVCSSSQVLNLKVRCSNQKDGCQWVDELRHVVPHEREECEWAVVGCSYQCGAHLPRRLMAEHEHEECPQRPMDVKLESFMKKTEERHQREMAEQNKEMECKMAEQNKVIKEMESMMFEQNKEMVTVRDSLQKMKVCSILLVVHTNTMYYRMSILLKCLQWRRH